ncbi:MAG: tRNA guanosine(34) transglycosylase Tgt [Alphaproteobacteria bacterium]
MSPNFSFKFQHASSSHKGRFGQLQTPHGRIETPAFIFCATKASLKGLSTSQIKQTKCQIILSNTYHLMLQPGSRLIARQGGLHQFMGWDGPMLTDSGGFQIFSLGHGSVACEIKGNRNFHRSPNIQRITEEGATFKSYLDGSMHTLTPELSIQVQHELGADLIVVLDECTPFHVEKQYTESSMHLSHRWALRSLSAFQHLETEKQALYGIVQGGVYPDLRALSAQFVSSHPFFGHAIGGSLGAHKSQMDEVVGMTMENLSPERPIHLLGIGGLRDIFEGVKKGIDTFDCVHPTRLARHGGALIRPHYWNTAHEPFHPREHINLKRACFREDDAPIDATCPCETCKTYSRAYLHHLLKAKELLALSAITLHNVTFMNCFLEALRQHLKTDTLDTLRPNWLF